MNEGKRPGGLTALAIINFIFAGFGILSLVGLAALFAFIDKVPTAEMEATQRQQIEALREMGAPVLIAVFVLSLISSILLLVSGIGYLQQKRLLGRMVGNAYAIMSIVGSIVSGVLFRTELGGGFNIGTIIGLVYPVLTLVLVNTTFKDDLSR